MQNNHQSVHPAGAYFKPENRKLPAGWELREPTFHHQQDPFGVESDGFYKVFTGYHHPQQQQPNMMPPFVIDPKKVVTRVDMKTKGTVKANHQAARTYGEVVLGNLNTGCQTPVDIWADDFIVDVKLYEPKQTGKDIDEITAVYDLTHGSIPIYRIDRNRTIYRIYHNHEHVLRDERLCKVINTQGYRGVIVEKSVRIPLDIVRQDVCKYLSFYNRMDRLALISKLRDELMELRDTQHIRRNLMVEMTVYYLYSTDALNRNNCFLYLPETDLCLYLGEPGNDIEHPADYFDLKYMFFIEKEVSLSTIIDIVDNNNHLSNHRYIYLFGKVKEIPVRRNVPGIKDGVYIIETRNQEEIHIEYRPLEDLESLGIYKSREEAESGGNPQLLKDIELQRMKSELERKRIEYEEAIKQLKIQEKEILNKLTMESGEQRISLQKKLNQLMEEKAEIEHRYKREKLEMERQFTEERMRMEETFRKERERMEKEQMEKEHLYRKEKLEMEKELERERMKREKLASTNNVLKVTAGILTTVVGIMGLMRTVTAL